MGLSREGKSLQKMVFPKRSKNHVYFHIWQFLDLKSRVVSRTLEASLWPSGCTVVPRPTCFDLRAYDLRRGVGFVEVVLATSEANDEHGVRVAVFLLSECHWCRCGQGSGQVQRWSSLATKDLQWSRLQLVDGRAQP